MRLSLLAVLVGAASFATPAAAQQSFWTDWHSVIVENGVTKYVGTITVTRPNGQSASVDVKYSSPLGLGFFQTDDSQFPLDYLSDLDRQRNPVTSPYTSADVPTIPPAHELIGLIYDQRNTLEFSRPVTHPLFAFVSLNDNVYSFDHDFEILSVANASTGKACGYWGCGTATRQVVVRDGRTEYHLFGTGEPHGTIRINGTFDAVNWNTLAWELWSGFTVGVAGLAEDVPSCFPVRLGDYNLFLTGSYSGGHDVQGKVAAGGDIQMTDFAVGAGLASSDTAGVLVAGGNLSLSRGAVFGDARYGGSYSGDGTVTYAQGGVAQGTPIDFAARGAQLRGLSARLAGLPANGSTRREPWGGIMLRGTDPAVNVFDVDASAFTGATLLSIDAPAHSLAVLNIRGSSATFTGHGSSFAGGIDQRGVLLNFVDATAIHAHGYGFWGTVLAPLADITFSNGSFDGGIFAKSLTGNAEGHINPLHDRDLCPAATP